MPLCSRQPPLRWGVWRSMRPLSTTRDAFGRWALWDGISRRGQLQLLSGRLPGTAGEAALTTSVLDSIGASGELGQTVTLQAVHGDDAPVLP